MNNTIHKVKVLPNKIIIEAKENENLMSALLRHGIDLGGVCGGKGLCGKCLIKVIEGKTSETTVQEKKWQKAGGFEYRLACQTRILSDATIEVLETFVGSKMKILSWIIEKKFELEPSVKILSLNIKKPSLEHQEADLNKILSESKLQTFDPRILKKISHNLWNANFKVNAIVYNEELLDILPQEPKTKVYGIAFDIGTTTVVGYLYNLEDGSLISVRAKYNEQIKFGEDVISRIDFAGKSDKNMKLMQEAVISTINSIIEELVKAANISYNQIYDMVCSGNTVMTSFLLGNDCHYSSKAPYIPSFTLPVKCKARDLGIMVNQTAYIRTLPLISAYVGGDVVADILVSEIYKASEPTALIDLGTNGEVVVKVGEKFLATSCAAGPALEGYSIRNGMRAVEGAIESVSISEDGNEVYYRTIGGSKPVGICGSGIIETIAWMKIRGIINKTGKILEGSSKRVFRENGELQFLLAKEDETMNGKKIVITQTDIRKIQLAKAAIFSSLITLSRLGNIEVLDLHKLFVAGAFGTYVDPFYAIIIGLLPDIPRERFIQIGNGSGAGASMLLLSRKKWEEATDIVKSVSVIELNLIKFFKDEFINATYFPHKNEELFKNSLEKLGLL
ncbi:MAG: ASKHA domain-containing protein [Nitrososphaeria archaeon]|nr:ASKHA domain-containing protein [Nitrososphaeria archaeon]